MRQLVFVGILTGALAGLGYAQAAAQQSPPTTGQKKAAPAGKAALKAPGQTASAAGVLDTITLPAPVTANGQPLSKGTYQLRLSDEEVKPAPGTAPGSERWVEFVQRGQVKGREVASVMPNSEISKMGEDKQPAPPPGKPRVQLLKEKQYYRVWISKGGNSYLIHLPPA
jgi:hypothetical protein